MKSSKDSSSQAKIQDNTANSSVLKAAGAMGAGTFLSRILGLVREQVFAYFFGAGNLTDAFLIAFRIPNLLRDLFAEGALSSAFVPSYTKVREQEGQERAWRVAGLVFRVLFIFLSLLSIVGIFYSDALVGFYAPSFKLIPGKFEMTVLMTQIMFPFFPLVALAAAYMGILNACGYYFIPAFASALFNLSSIITGLLFAWILPRFGYEAIIGMAVGVVIGGFVQAFFQLPFLYRAGYKWKARNISNNTQNPTNHNSDSIWYKEPALKNMLVLMLPGILGMAATQINIQVNSVLATSQGPGAVSWLSYASRLMQFPIGLFGVSLAAATLPQVSKLFVHQKETEIRDLLSASLRKVFAINLIATAGLMSLGYSIVQLLFEYGRFTSNDTRSSYYALLAYAVGLPFYSAVKVLVPASYAVKRTQAAVISSVLSVIVTIVTNLLLIDRMGYVGLALGTSIAAIFNFLYLSIALKQYIQAQKIIKTFLQTFWIAGVMGCCCCFAQNWSQEWMSRGGMLESLPFSLSIMKLVYRLFFVGLWVSLSIGLIYGVAVFSRHQDLLDVFNLFLSKIKNKLAQKSKAR